tara:strand:+ start:2861 stop:3286 length:426 start_codon:yes stop_codon:yes gene_type:complete
VKRLYPTNRLLTLSHQYRALKRAIESELDRVFPFECVVRVSNPSFHGVGIVARNDACPAHKLPVLVESGNVWFYEIETIDERLTRPRDWPVWVRQRKMQIHRDIMAARERERTDAAATELVRMADEAGGFIVPESTTRRTS